MADKASRSGTASSGWILRLTPTAAGFVSIGDPSFRHVVPLEAASEISRQAPEVVASMKAFAAAHDLQGDRIVIFVGHELAYLTIIDRSQVTGAVSHDSMRFAVESVLPLDAESVEIDFRPSGDSILCVVVTLDPLSAMVDALEADGMKVCHIVVEPFLLLQRLIESERLPGDALVNRRANSGATAWSECVKLRNGLPIFWSRCVDDPLETSRELRMASAGAGADDCSQPDVVHRLVDPGDGGPPIPDLATREIPVDGDDELAAAAAQLLGRRREPWFELRRGVLAKADPLRATRGSLRAFLITSAAAVAITCVMLSWRAKQYTTQTRVAEDAMRDSFKSTLPNQRVPAAILNRMRSEHRQALGQRRVGGDVDPPTDVLQVLRPLIVALPVDLELRVQSLRIDDGEFSLDVDLGSYNDAAAIARSLERSGFQIQPPSSTRGGAGLIRTRIRGVWDRPEGTPR